MKATKRLLPALVFSALAAFAAPAAEAAQFSGFYAFGDSLVDAGYYRPYLLSVGVPPALASQLGRFTTSPDPVWSERVSQFYGYAPAPSNVSGGNIFAQGGARVNTDSANTPTGAAQRPVSTQVSEYLARNGGAADPNALYGLWVGANDLFLNLIAFAGGQISQAQLQTNVVGAAAAEVQQIGRLKAAGARYILVFGLPDIGIVPRFNGSAVSSSVTALSAGYNTTLFTGLASAGIKVIPVDIFSLFTEFKANPRAFGFANASSQACGPFPPFSTTGDAFFCPPPAWVAPNADVNFAYADDVHPSGGSHRVIAQFVESLIEGPTQYGFLAEAPLHARESHVRTVSDGLTSNRYQPIGKWQLWVSGDRGTFDVDAGTGNSGLGSISKSLTLGSSVRASESTTLGVAVGKSTNTNNFGNDAGGFKTDELAFSLLAMSAGGASTAPACSRSRTSISTACIAT